MKMDINKDVSTILLSMKDLSVEMYILCLWERWLRHFVSHPFYCLWFVTCFKLSYAFYLLLHVKRLLYRMYTCHL